MIINGDCLTELKKIDDNRIDCIITSPPYNLKALRGNIKQNNHTNKSVNIDYDNYNDDMDEDEYKKWQIDVLNECFRIIKPTGSIFYNHKIRRWNKILHHPWDFLSQSNAKLYQQIIWDRGNSSNVRKEYLLPTTELIFWFRKENPQVFKDNAIHKSEVWRIKPTINKIHPASYPEELVKNCILLTTLPGDTVLDPFNGSGTTGIAAQILNREYIGIEISKDYCELTLQRGVK